MMRTVSIDGRIRSITSTKIFAPVSSKSSEQKKLDFAILAKGGLMAQLAN